MFRCGGLLVCSSALFLASIHLNGQDITLAWDPNSEADLAGYNVYRSTTSGLGYKKINRPLVPPSPRPTYTDASDKSGLSAVYYRVTAVNTSGLESGFSNEVFRRLTAFPCDPTPAGEGDFGSGCGSEDNGSDPTLLPTGPRQTYTVVAPAGIQLANSWVGLALVNSGSASSSVVVSVKTEDGDDQRATTLDSPLHPFGQQAFLSSEMGGTQNGAVTLLAKSGKNPIQGFFMAGDSSSKYMDGLGEIKASTSLYLPVASLNLRTTSDLSVYNPTDGSVQLMVELFNESGVSLSRHIESLPAKGTFKGTHKRIFGTFGNGDGYLKITGTYPVQAFQFTLDGKTLSAVAAQELVPTDRLLAPHFFVDGHGGTSEIRLLNLDSGTVDLTVRARDNSGSVLGTGRASLASGQLLVTEVEDLLGLDPTTSPSGIIVGYVEVVMDGGPADVIGTITFAGNQGNFRSTLPLMREGRLETLLPHVAQSQALRIFNGLAVLNPNGGAAEVKVRAYAQTGRLSGEAEFSLGPGERIAALLDESVLFGAGFEQVSGHMRISSTEPVVVFALLGGYDLQYLSAIEVQERLH